MQRGDRVLGREGLNLSIIILILRVLKNYGSFNPFSPCKNIDLFPPNYKINPFPPCLIGEILTLSLLVEDLIITLPLLVENVMITLYSTEKER